MPKLNGLGPDGKGAKTGRKLGKCTSFDNNSLLERLGKGLGLKRRCGGGKGQGRRINSGQNH